MAYTVTMERRHWIGLGMLAAAALTLRLVYLLQADDSPLFFHPIVDARTYVRAALHLAEGQWLGPPQPFWQPPLYPYFLAGSFALFGENYHLPRLVQALSGTAVCLLVFHLGRRAFSPAAGWIAAGAAALYGPFLYFEGELLPASLAVFLNALALTTLLWAAAGRATGRWLAAGLLLGLAALNVPSVLLFVPAALLWARLRARASLPALGLLVLGIALAVAPVTLRNRLVGGEWVPISHNAGINFYIGNNPDSDDTTRIRPGRGWQELTGMPEREAGITGKGASSRYFFGRSWDYLAADPVAYGLLQLRKLHQFWRGDEIPRNLDPYFARSRSWLLQGLLWIRGLAFPFGLVGPLALTGLILYLRSPQARSPAADLLLLFAAAYMLAVVLFFVTGRYRLPVVPVLLLFAGYGITRVRGFRGRQLALGIALPAVLVLALNTGLPAMDTEGSSQEHLYLASAYAEQGLLANALRHYDEALEREPDHEIALHDAGAALARRGDVRRAAETWERLVDRYPDRSDVRLRLAAMTQDTGDHARAVRHFERLAAEEPERAVFHARLARSRAHLGDLEGAAADYRRALELDPGALSLHRQLARLEIQRGNADAARPHVRELERQAGDDADARREVEELHRLLGEADEAAADSNLAPHMRRQ